MKTKRERVKLIELFHQRHADFSGKKMILCSSYCFHRENRKYQQVTITHSEANSDTCQTSEVEPFAKIIKVFSLSFFRKCCILNVWQSSEYAFQLFQRKMEVLRWANFSKGSFWDKNKKLFINRFRLGIRSVFSSNYSRQTFVAIAWKNCLVSPKL